MEIQEPECRQLGRRSARADGLCAGLSAPCDSRHRTAVKFNCLQGPSPKLCVCQRPRWPGQSPKPGPSRLSSHLNTCSEVLSPKLIPSGNTKPQDFLTIHPDRLPMLCPSQVQSKVGSSPFPACRSNAHRGQLPPKTLLGPNISCSFQPSFPPQSLQTAAPQGSGTVQRDCTSPASRRDGSAGQGAGRL